jgi:hypothetical protein
MERASDIPENFAPGDIVKFSEPQPGEESARFVVTEWNGDRGFIQLITDRMTIPPVELVRARDLVVVKRAK